MERRREFGLIGEYTAQAFLTELGYSILETNFRTREGEIDCIAKDGEQYVFVEVKRRKDEAYAEITDLIPKSKYEKIEKVGLHYLSENGIETENYRIDLILIIGHGTKERIEHLKALDTEE